MDNPGRPDFLQPTQWQRISPLAIVYFVVKAIKQLASNLIYLIPALAISYNTIQDNPSVWLPLASGITLFFLGSALLQYYFYQFRPGSNKLEIKTGVFAKKHLDLPFERIQNVTLEQPLYYRFTNTVCVILDTAGSASQEANIVALPAAEAEQLKRFLLAYKSTETSNPAPASDADSSAQSNPDPEQILITRTIKDLCLHGITNNRVWIILGVLAPVYDDIGQFIAAQLERTGVEYQQFFSSNIQTLWQFILAALALALVVITLVTLISIVGSIIMFYGYTLYRSEDKYVRRSGLFTRHEVTMRRSRIQLLVAKQDWLDVLVKRINLYLKQNTSGAMPNADHQGASNLLIPSVTFSQAGHISNDALPGNRLFSSEFMPISKAFILRQCLTWLLPLLIISSILSALRYGAIAVLVCQAVGVLLLGLVVLRWKRWGISADEHFTYVRKGLIGVDYYCFESFKIQQTQFKQSILMRRRELANVRYVLASGAIDIPFLHAGRAQQLLSLALYKTSVEPRSWM